MRRWSAWTPWMAAFAVIGCARSPESPGPAVASLVEAERAFAAASESLGVRAAFLAHLVPEAVVFRPQPIAVGDWYRDRPSPPGTLRWQPDFAAVSHHGDLGYTSGPWEYLQSAADSLAAATGHFVSVWKRQSGGVWRVVLDLGNSHAPEPKAPALEFGPSGAARAGGDAEAVKLLLVAAEKNLAERVGRDGMAAFLEHCAADVRCLRDGSPPAIGRDAAKSLLETTPPLASWDAMAADAARGGDLGYTYGSARVALGGADRDTWYVRIWRRRTDGTFEIVLDIVPTPPDS